MEETGHLVQNIAKNIRALRMSKRLTQKEVAKAIGIHLSQYARIENAKIHAPVVTIVQIAEFFNVSVSMVVVGREMTSKTKALSSKKKSLEEKFKELEKSTKKDVQIACEMMELLIIKDKLRGLEDETDTSE